MRSNHTYKHRHDLKKKFKHKSGNTCRNEAHGVVLREQPTFDYYQSLQFTNNEIIRIP